MDQQAWKKDLDDEARKNGEEGEGNSKAKTTGRKGKGKGRGRGTGGKGRGGKGRGGRGKTVEDENPKESESHPKASKPKPGAKKKPAAALHSTDDVLKTPVRSTGPKAPSPAGPAGGKKRKTVPKPEASEEDITPPKAPKVVKTFARRYMPKTTWGKYKWQALKTVFASIISVRFKAPSLLEAGFFEKNMNWLKTIFVCKRIFVW